MNSEFNWWLLIVGLVVGAALVWLVLADGRRRDADVTEAERESEARWIAEAMRAAGRRIEDADALDVLRLHEAYLAASPPDNLDEIDERALGERSVPELSPADGRPVAPAGTPGDDHHRLLPRETAPTRPELRPPMAHRIEDEPT